MTDYENLARIARLFKSNWTQCGGWKEHDDDDAAHLAGTYMKVRPLSCEQALKIDQGSIDISR